MTSMKRLITELGVSRRLAITGIESKTLMIEIVGASQARFTKQEIEQVLGFNERCMRVIYTTAQRRDLIPHYRRKSFFMLGDIT